MTYCVAIKTRAGLVFLSDSRTNAGLDMISTYRKMIIYEKAGDRFMVLLSAGNLSISQLKELYPQFAGAKDKKTLLKKIAAYRKICGSVDQGNGH